MPIRHRRIHIEDGATYENSHGQRVTVVCWAKDRRTAQDRVIVRPDGETAGGEILTLTEFADCFRPVEKERPR